MKSHPALTFGIYPGGRVGTLSPGPDDTVVTASLIDDLRCGRPFVIREYVHFLGGTPDSQLVTSLGAAREMTTLTLPDAYYQVEGHLLDLVVSYIPTDADLPGWLRFLDAVIDRYGHLAHFLQVTLEPNFPIPLIDGSAPGVLIALTKGIPYAKQRLAEHGFDHVKVGFSVAEPPEWLGGDGPFWSELGKLPFETFAQYIDYVGLALYPDAFSPVAPPGQPGDLESLTRHAIEQLRKHSLPLAHIPAGTPLHIAENGSPSGPPRDEAQQVASITTMIRTIHALSTRENITHYELFNLRDADSSSDQAVASLGLVTSSYRPKQSFQTYCDLVQELGAELTEP